MTMCIINITDGDITLGVPLLREGFVFKDNTWFSAAGVIGSSGINDPVRVWVATTNGTFAFLNEKKRDDNGDGMNGTVVTLVFDEGTAGPNALDGFPFGPKTTGSAIIRTQGGFWAQDTPGLTWSVSGVRP